MDMYQETHFQNRANSRHSNFLKRWYKKIRKDAQSHPLTYIVFILLLILFNPSPNIKSSPNIGEFVADKILFSTMTAFLGAACEIEHRWTYDIFVLFCIYYFWYD